MNLANIDFNKISYDEGLALVKEAKLTKRSAGEAASGILEQIKQFIGENPELLKRVGIGAATGGGLGILSGLTGEPRTRRPLSRGLTGALLGALGGGAYHAGSNLLGKYNQMDAVESVKDFADKAMREGGKTREEVISGLKSYAQQKGLDIDEAAIERAVPSSPKQKSMMEPVLGDTPDTPLGGILQRGVLGGVAGGAIGNPWAQRKEVAQAVAAGSGGDTAVAKILESANKAKADWSKLDVDKRRGVDPLNAEQKNVTRATDNLKKLVDKGKRIPFAGASLRSPVTKANSKWQLQKPYTYNPQIRQDYNTVKRILNPGRQRARAAGAGATLAILLPDLLRLLGRGGSTLADYTTTPVSNWWQGEQTLDASPIEDSIKQLDN